jgi:cytochrome c
MLRQRSPIRVSLALWCAAGAVALMPLNAFSQTNAAPKTEGAAPAAAPAGGGGEEAYNNACRTCHATKAGDNRLGPSLAGIVGKKAGGAGGYAYSESLKNSGITFDEKTLDAFIANPDAVVPGNNMKPYSGITDADLRAKIIAHLKAN